MVLPVVKPHTKRLSAAHVSNLLYAMGKVKVHTSGVFPLHLTQAVIKTAPFMTAKQLSSAASGAASWPLSRDLVVRIMRALKPEVLDRIKHHEIAVADVRTPALPLVCVPELVSFLTTVLQLLSARLTVCRCTSNDPCATAGAHML